ncbi:hypothetical protein NKH77_02645 [Streptomyces sp. M19]
MGYAHEYADAIMRRGRVPMEPVDFVPDWADRPRKGKYYPGAETFPLPDAGYPRDATVDDGLFGADRDEPFTLPLLGGMLRDSYGLTGRRLGVQANTDLGSLPSYPQANWSRGTASGGGLYPAAVYWVSGASGPLTPGVYHYAPRHHAVQRLLAGDVSARVRAAVGRNGRAAPTSSWSWASSTGRTPSSTTASPFTPSAWTSARSSRPGGCGHARVGCASPPPCGSTSPPSRGSSASRATRRACSPWCPCGGGRRAARAVPSPARPPGPLRPLHALP